METIDLMHRTIVASTHRALLERVRTADTYYNVSRPAGSLLGRGRAGGTYWNVSKPTGESDSSIRLTPIIGIQYTLNTENRNPVYA